MQIYYTDHFVLPLPEGHRFPMSKYARLRERVLAAGIVPPHELVEPAPATQAQLTHAHDATYVQRVFEGRLPQQEQRRIGFPWSPAMVERARRSVGATLGAARAALRDGFGVNLAGVEAIVQLTARVRELEAEVAELRSELAAQRRRR